MNMLFTLNGYRAYQTLMYSFPKGAQSALYVSRRTFVFDPLSRFGCGHLMHKAGIPWSLIKQLHALGEAQYPLDVYSHNLPIPSDEFLQPKRAPSPRYRFIAFSRVAFNRAHDEAVFAFRDTCGSECGGGTVHARRVNGAWSFRNEGCVWSY